MFVPLKVKISEKTSLLEEAEKRITELTSKVEEQQKLILKLEDDILKVSLHATLIIQLIPINPRFLQLFMKSVMGVSLLHLALMKLSHCNLNTVTMLL